MLPDMLATFTSTLADISPQDVGQIILTILGVGGGGYGIFALGKSKAVKIDPQPLEVQATPQYATKAELKELEDKHDRFEKEMRDTLRDGEQRTHKRIDDVASKVDEAIGIQKATAKTTEQILDVLLHPHHHTPQQ